MDDESLVLRYLETFRLPVGVAVPDLLAALGRIMGDSPPVVGPVREVVLRETASWRLRAEVVTPAADGPHPVIVYLHGGGWTTGTPAGYRRVSCEFAARGWLVVAPDYRRAPRHRFPAGLDDCRFAIDWVAEHGDELGADPRHFVVAGDSAGANLAAGALACGVFAPVTAALLFYGIYNFHAALPLIGEVVGRPSAEEQMYVPIGDFERLRADPRVSPVLAADRLPPTFLSVGSRDPLLGETLTMAKRMDELGAPSDLVVYDDTPHGFLQLPFHSAQARGYHDALRFACRHTLRHE